MSPEKGGPSPEEQMNYSIDAARQATEAAGNLSTMELGQATRTIETVESMGDVVNGPFVQTRVRSNNEGGSPGEVQSTEVSADAVKQNYSAEGITGSEYHVDIKDQTTGTNTVDVRRTNDKGETYSHTFKNPDSAKKFANLIAKHVTRRAEQPEDKAA